MGIGMEIGIGRSIGIGIDIGGDRRRNKDPVHRISRGVGIGNEHRNRHKR